MKKTIGICLFTVILFICIIGSISVINRLSKQKMEGRLTDMTEIQTEKETEIAESMQIQEAYRYLLIEENGVLIVYEKDARTVLLETNIQLYGLDEETQRQLHEGIWIRDEEELYNFLESYSS